MKTALTPLQKLYWEREEIINKLYDKRISDKTKISLINEAYRITREMDKMNGFEVKIA